LNFKDKKHFAETQYYQQAGKSSIWLHR